MKDNTMKNPKTPQGPAGAKRKKKALGRGLDSLIPAGTSYNEEKKYFECPVDLIRPNPNQPRTRFSDERLESLARSIQKQGVIQPILLRKEESGYELIAGERRLRAARKAGLSKVPAVIKNLSDKASLEISIVENVQREDLNPIEEAEAYGHLMSEFHLTQEQVAERVGKSRSTVANFLRLRNLPAPIIETLMDGSLGMGHARALLGADDPSIQMAAWRLVVSGGLSVRQTEALVKKLKKEDPAPKKTEKNPDQIYFSRVAEDLSRHFGARVQIRRRGKKGRLEIDFYSDDDLDRLLGMLKGD
ncbi:Stage 0 sporulation protein J [Candidatus Desulfarcum epimagneticum]|uniref:Stage 0 sporulation protein J n=1 Tax=uncultured Desulfobacteraceae bacterium TaxID=218296 RepID=A0A484HJA9_9BACT|nr:Stage 0 sporulation protein J [uncultured Desulfobacteraceae bacterium]